MRPGRLLRAVAFAGAVGSAVACAGVPTPGDSPAPPIVVRTVAPIADRVAVPIVVDTDLDADDLVALTILAGDPAVDLRAVTVSGTGIVHCEAGVDIARRWLALLDRASVPVACGREEPGPGGRAFPAEWRLRADGLFGLALPAVAATTGPGLPADGLLRQAAAGGTDRLTIVALGPWTNLADAVRNDPDFAGRVRAVHAMLGALEVPGNVDLGETHPEHRVEWNAGADPDAVAAVFATDVPVTLVPLDATNAVPLTTDLVEATAAVGAGTGADLVSQMYLRDPAIGTSGQSLWDSLTALLVTDPELATWGDVRVTVATTGTSAGALAPSDVGRPIRAAIGADGSRAVKAWLAALTRTTVRIGPDGRFLP